MALASLTLAACEGPGSAATPVSAPAAAAPAPTATASTALAPAAMGRVSLAPDRLIATLEPRFARQLGDALLEGAADAPAAYGTFGLLGRAGAPDGPHARLAALATQAGGRVVYVEPTAAVAWIQLGPGADVRQATAHLRASAEVIDVRRDPLARGADGGADPFADGDHPGCKGKGNPHCKDGGKGPKKKDPTNGDGPGIDLPKPKSAAAPAGGPKAWHRDALGIDGLRFRDELGRPVVVAILDTGLTLAADGYPAAPALAHVPVLPGVDFVNLDDDPADDNGHGTLMASLLAADGAFPGVAPDVTLLPIKVLDADRVGSEAALAAGLRHAIAKQVDVISMSLAFPEGFIPSAELSSAITAAQQAGIVVLAASGNHGGNEVSYPAAFGSVVSVGAGRLAIKHVADGAPALHKLRRADYSGYGAAIDVIGPGGSSTHDYNLDGYPDGIPAMGPTPEGDGYGWYLVTGTSAATVQVAGVAALMLSAGADPADVPLMLQVGAAHLPGFDDAAGFDTLHGAGAVNASRAIKLAAKAKITAGPDRFVNPVLTLVEDGAGRRRAVALVEVIDDDNGLLPGVTVLAHFRGDTRHDVIGETDASGRVLFASAPADAGTMWEFGVDAILDGPMHALPETATVPLGFARFERVTFRTLASFSATGAGFEPSTFILGVDAEALMPFIQQRALTTPRGEDPWLTGLVAPVATVPEDLEDWTPVPSLFARSYAMAGERAPTAIVFDRVLMTESCAFADRWVPVVSRGAGFEPSTFILDGSYLAVPPGGDQVVVRGGSLFLNDQPTTPAQLGLLIGKAGIAIIGDSDATCPPRERLVTNLDVFPEAVREGTGAASWGGFTLTVAADEDDPGFAQWSEAWQVAQQEAAGGAPSLEQTLLGASWGLAPFATGAMATVHASDASGSIQAVSDGPPETP